MEAPTLPPWWGVLDSWNLIASDPRKIADRARQIEANSEQRRTFFDQLLAAYLFDENNPDRTYGPLVRAAKPPVLVHTGAAVVDQALFAGCLAYQTVVVPDPVWMVHRYWLWSQRGPIANVTEAEAEDAIIRLATLVVEHYLCHLIPLAREGVVTFDAHWGPVAQAQDVWLRVPAVTLAAWRQTWHDSEVAAEAVWAAARARSIQATVGTMDSDFAKVLKLVTSDLEGKPDPPHAVEVPILMPYVGDLSVRDMLSLRLRYADSLAQFRAAIQSLTAELRSLKPGDVNENRVRQAASDYLDGELAKLGREWTAVKSFRYGAVAAAAVSLGTAAWGVMTGMPVSLSAVLPVASGTAALTSAVASLGFDSVRMKGNNLYVLWQASQRSVRKRSPR